MPVGDINLWLYICPSAPAHARIGDSRIAVGVVRHAPGMRSTELDVLGAGTFVRRGEYGPTALLHGVRDRMVHFVALSVLHRLVLKCLYAPSAGEGAFAIPRTSRERSFLRRGRDDAVAGQQQQTAVIEGRGDRGDFYSSGLK